MIGSSIKHIPLAGRDITNFIHLFIRDREKGVPPEQALLVAQKLKEKHCYVCSDIAKEFQKYDENPSKYIESYSGFNAKTNSQWKIDVGYERFLGPEIFFNPDIYSSDFTKPLPDVVDGVIQSCPIDCRRALYKVCFSFSFLIC